MTPLMPLLLLVRDFQCRWLVTGSPGRLLLVSPCDGSHLHPFLLLLLQSLPSLSSPAADPVRHSMEQRRPGLCSFAVMRQLSQGLVARELGSRFW